MSSYKNETPVWDLSDIYSGESDSKINKDKKQVTKFVTGFTKKYKGKISKTKDPRFLTQALEDLEQVLLILYKYSSYTNYLHSTNTQEPKIGRFYQESREFGNKISASLEWFDIELKAINDKDMAAISKSKFVAQYRHYLAHIRAFIPYTLTEKEEVLLTKKDQTSTSAFVRFYDELLGAKVYKLKIGKKIKKLTYQEVARIIFNDPDRGLRKNATMILSKSLAADSKQFSFIFNNLLLDKKISDEIRGYADPREATMLSYEVPTGVVDAMSSVVTANNSLVERYYKCKEKLVGHKLYEWDRYSNIYTLNKRKYTFNEAREIILESFMRFSQEFHDIAKMFFDKNWIHAAVIPGKVSGAYCSYNTPNHHPYILVNFLGEISDISTLAHELGHGIHAYLSRSQNIYNFWPSTAIAEVASVFAESIVFDNLLQKVTDKKEKINLLAAKIENGFATIYRQNAFYMFEKEVHKLRRSQGELAPEQFGKIYTELLQNTFGKGLTLTDNHSNWWIPISHFFHYNFYVFTYCFGELIAYTLYSMHKKQGDDFVKKYLKALSMGGSDSPIKLVSKQLGINVNDKKFWELGIDLVEKRVKEFEKLAK